MLGGTINTKMRKAGMPTGYKFAIDTCPECGRQVPRNWMVRHLKSKCAVPGRRVYEATEEWEGQLCPYTDCAWRCTLDGDGWYQCPNCGRPFFASECDSDFEDYHCYRDGGAMGPAPNKVNTVAGDAGPSWFTNHMKGESDYRGTD